MRRYGFRLKRISRPETAADIAERRRILPSGGGYCRAAADIAERMTRQEAAETVTAEISERFSGDEL